ncbi:hypothetical protein [Halorubrum sp. SD683]|uniref:hypothetical protein n=1 Tax=Halorubrum sp. SD683 TaxID=1855873 RepID=UPI000A2D666E|nr:hypothetical protein [Halorubrum sp. SD683]OTF01895.1 hypothetical protein B9G49_01225 [Halorubrum sp. SD683]
MTESESALLDYYSAGWTEEIYGENYVEWVYHDDLRFSCVSTGRRAKGHGHPGYGRDPTGEEFVTRPLSGLSRDDAFDVAATLVYAVNGAAGYVHGDAEFSGE